MRLFSSRNEVTTQTNRIDGISELEIRIPRWILMAGQGFSRRCHVSCPLLEPVDMDVLFLVFPYMRKSLDEGRGQVELQILFSQFGRKIHGIPATSCSSSFKSSDYIIEWMLISTVYYSNWNIKFSATSGQRSIAVVAVVVIFRTDRSLYFFQFEF